MRVDDLTSAHRAELAGFECKVYREEWTEVVEEMVRDRLADAIDDGHVKAIGAWNTAGLLVGVGAWSADPKDAAVWLSHVLAVRFGHMRRGIGRSLKRTMLDRASAAGIELIVSRIHQDNDAIRLLNESLGGTTARPAGDRDHLMCTIPVTRRRQ